MYIKTSTPIITVPTVVIVLKLPTIIAVKIKLITVRRKSWLFDNIRMTELEKLIEILTVIAVKIIIFHHLLKLKHSCFTI